MSFNVTHLMLVKLISKLEDEEKYWVVTMGLLAKLDGEPTGFTILPEELSRRHPLTVKVQFLRSEMAHSSNNREEGPLDSSKWKNPVTACKYNVIQHEEICLQIKPDSLLCHFAIPSSCSTSFCWPSDVDDDLRKKCVFRKLLCHEELSPNQRGFIARNCGTLPFEMNDCTQDPVVLKLERSITLFEQDKGALVLICNDGRRDILGLLTNIRKENDQSTVEALLLKPILNGISLCGCMCDTTPC